MYKKTLVIYLHNITFLNEAKLIKKKTTPINRSRFLYFFRKLFFYICFYIFITI